MGVRLLSRWARGPAAAGIDPAKRPAGGAKGLSLSLTSKEPALLSRWARGPAAAGIDPAKGPAGDAKGLILSPMPTGWARVRRGARVAG
jgi:hypothetical protein